MSTLIFDRDKDIYSYREEDIKEILYEEESLPEINYLEGDLFSYLDSVSNICVPHVCNVAGFFGGGFAKTVKDLYPKTNKLYSESCEKFQLDKDKFYEPMTFFTPEKFGVFANMTIQRWKSGSIGRNATYPDLIKVMEDVKEFCLENDVTEIWSCKFGAGLCGMSWPYIEELIKDIWLTAGLKVTIFVLPETKPRS